MADEPFEFLEEPEWEDDGNRLMEAVFAYSAPDPMADLPEDSAAPVPSPILQEAAVVEVEPSPEEALPEPHQPDLVINISSCGELEKDLRRIRNIYGYLCSHPGDGHFAFHIAERDSVFALDFPNDRVELSQTLMDGLGKLIGIDDRLIWNA